ncbi:MAG: hypothetical protein ABIW47_08580 [Ginsengibacter sp.]|jgi:hypothetical protein
MQNADLLSSDLTVTTISRGLLSETAKWAKFLSILGFISCGLMAIIAFFLPFLMTNMPGNEMIPMGGSVMTKGMGSMLTVFYLGFALLLLMPCLYLYRFSTKMKIALIQYDSMVLDSSFSNLKSFFKFYGIMSIILFSIYALIFILGIVGVAIFSSMS